MRKLEEVNAEIADVEADLDVVYARAAALNRRKRELIEEATEIMIASPPRFANEPLGPGNVCRVEMEP